MEVVDRKEGKDDCNFLKNTDRERISAAEPVDEYGISKNNISRDYHANSSFYPKTKNCRKMEPETHPVCYDVPRQAE
ncbi:MAG: hypothetical protein OSJ44_16320, partial [Lachnospiraceae bacterium]|nr:hypothetical protein [Lachnospiraceae bacterium]